MKLLIHVFFIMSVILTSHSYSDTFKSKRAEAIKDYNDRKVKLAFKKLKTLVKKGDSEAARDMGILLIRGKFGKDVDKAFDWFEVSAKMCNPRALEFLKSKYLERGGVYFKPARIEYLKSKCENYKIKNKKFVEKPKKNKISKNKYSENILEISLCCYR